MSYGVAVRSLLAGLLAMALSVPTGITVPSVIGLTLREARVVLRENHLWASVGGSEGEEPLKVVAQDPGPGTVVQPGSTVLIYLGSSNRTPTDEPTTEAPTTEEPTTSEPTTEQPTEQPTTTEPTEEPTSQEPTDVRPTSEESGNTLLLLLLAATVLIGGTVWSVRRLLRRPRATPQVIQCVPHPDLDPLVDIREVAPTVDISLECHPDPGHQTISEAER